MYVPVEMITAVVGVIGSIIVALVARLTGWTRDDRQRARIVRDAELWNALPKNSPARAPLGDHIATSTAHLLARRSADRQLDVMWSAGAWSAFAGWVLLLVFSTFNYDPFEPFWISQIRYALAIAICATAVLTAAFWGSAVWVGAPRAWRWLKSRF